MEKEERTQHGARSTKELEMMAAAQRVASAELDAECEKLTRKLLESGVIPPRSKICHLDGTWVVDYRGNKLQHDDLYDAVEEVWRLYTKTQMKNTFPKWGVVYRVEAKVDPELERPTELWMSLQFPEDKFASAPCLSRSTKWIQVGSISEAYAMAIEHCTRTMHWAAKLINETPGAEDWDE